jgi:hypothetical protein
MTRGGRDDDVYVVTSARTPHSAEVARRTRRYLISMGVRTLALVLAIFVLHGWLRLVAIVAGLILPWIAVVLANAGPVPDAEQPEYIDAEQPQLYPGDEAAAPDETRLHAG